MIRYLCLDLGDKRTGVAVGDTVVRLASPVTVLEVPITERNGDALLDAIARVCDEHLGPSYPVAPGAKPTASSGWGRAAVTAKLIVGLPLNMDGTEGPRSKAARTFAARIEARTGRTVIFRDERLSSAAADWTMAQSGLTHKQKKERRDALAAASILQGLLNEKKNGPAEAGPLEDD